MLIILGKSEATVWLMLFPQTISALFIKETKKSKTNIECNFLMTSIMI